MSINLLVCRMIPVERAKKLACIKYWGRRHAREGRRVVSNLLIVIPSLSLQIADRRARSVKVLPTPTPIINTTNTNSKLRRFRSLRGLSFDA